MDTKCDHPADLAQAAARPSREAGAAPVHEGETVVSAERPRLGEILVAQGKITQEQLAIAIERQKKSGRRLGEELIKAGFVKRGAVSLALRIQRRIVFGAIATMAVTTVPHDVEAATARSEIAVSALVPAQTAAQIVRQSAELTITEADIARGYIEIQAASQLRVTCNNPAGYVIDFFGRLPIFTAVRISSVDNSVDFGPDGGTIIERGRHGRDLGLNLSYRFTLGAGVLPGTYAWPLALNVRPL
jgi:hypothetical protein